MISEYYNFLWEAKRSFQIFYTSSDMHDIIFYKGYKAGAATAS